MISSNNSKLNTSLCRSCSHLVIISVGQLKIKNNFSPSTQLAAKRNTSFYTAKLFTCISVVKPNPCRITAALAGALSASMSDKTV